MNDLSQYSKQVTLRNGRQGVIRAIRSDDKPLLMQGFKRLSKQSAYNRFMTHKQQLSEQELSYLTEVNFKDHVAIVLILMEPEEDLIGVARYFVTASPEIAECAFTVYDSHQNMGVGTILFEHLVSIARQHGIETLHAEILVENGKMLEIFQHSGLGLKTEVGGGVASVELSLLQGEMKQHYT